VLLPPVIPGRIVFEVAKANRPSEWRRIRRTSRGEDVGPTRDRAAHADVQINRRARGARVNVELDSGQIHRSPIELQRLPAAPVATSALPSTTVPVEPEM